MSAIKIDREIMSGVPCFAGTRVPVKFLFDYLADGYGLDYFCYQYPTVERKQLQSVLEEVKATMFPDPQWLVEAERRRLAAKEEREAELVGVP